MNAVALIITAISATAAFACLLTGYVALVSLERNELDDFERRRQQLSFRGVLAPFQRWRWERRELLPLSRIVTHWRTRPAVRRLVCVGLIFLVIALISGQFSALPK